MLAHLSNSGQSQESNQEVRSKAFINFSLWDQGSDFRKKQSTCQWFPVGEGSESIKSTPPLLRREPTESKHEGRTRENHRNTAILIRTCCKKKRKKETRQFSIPLNDQATLHSTAGNEVQGTGRDSHKTIYVHTYWTGSQRLYSYMFIVGDNEKIYFLYFYLHAFSLGTHTYKVRIPLPSFPLGDPLLETDNCKGSAFREGPSLGIQTSTLIRAPCLLFTSQRIQPHLGRLTEHRKLKSSMQKFNSGNTHQLQQEFFHLSRDSFKFLNLRDHWDFTKVCCWSGNVNKYEKHINQSSALNQEFWTQVHINCHRVSGLLSDTITSKELFCSLGEHDSGKKGLLFQVLTINSNCNTDVLWLKSFWGLTTHFRVEFKLAGI